MIESAALASVFIAAVAMAALVNWRLNGSPRRTNQLREQENAHLIEQLRQDIAAHKAAELAQQEIDQRFRDSFQHAAIGKALAGLDGRWLQVNAALCEITGYGERELLTTTFQEITHPDDLDADLGQLRRLVAGEIPSYQLEKRYFHKLGHIVWILLSVSLVRDSVGTSLYLISEIQDITARKQLEADRVAVIEDRYREVRLLLDIGQSLLCTEDLTAFLEESVDRIMASGPYDVASIRLTDSTRERVEWAADRGYFDAANRVGYGASGRPREERVQRPRLLSDYDPVVLENLAGTDRYVTLQRDGVIALVWVPIRTEATTLGYLVAGLRTVRPITAGEVRLLTAIGSQMGIAAQKARLYEGTRQAQAERQQAEEQLRQAQKMEAIGVLAGGIAHEINTPIQFVGDNTRFLQDAFADLYQVLRDHRALLAALPQHEVDPALREALERSEAEADIDYLAEEVPKALMDSLDGVTRVATIVRALKDFAHPDSPEKAPADLNRALLSTLTVARNELKYVADVETDLADLPPVLCHIGELNQVFLNLLINAAHAVAELVDGTEERGQIRVSTIREGDTVVVAIEDNGCGIQDEIRDRVFDPFFTTKEVGRGTGQGLTLARAIIVEKHGGSLWFERNAGEREVERGTTFYVRLPVDGTNWTQAEVAA